MVFRGRHSIGTGQNTGVIETRPRETMTMLRFLILTALQYAGIDVPDDWCDFLAAFVGNVWEMYSVMRPAPRRRNRRKSR